MRNYLYLAIGTICLATIGVLVKLVGSEVHALTLVFYRVLLSFLFLFLVVPRVDSKAFRLSKKDVKDYFLLGALWTASTSMYISSLYFAPIQNVVLIRSIYPFFVFFFASLVLKECLTKTKIVTAIIAFIGLAVINPFQAGPYETGNILALASGIIFALVITEMRKEDKGHHIAHMMWAFFFAMILLLPAPFVLGFGNPSVAWPYLLFIGIVSTGAAYFFYNLGLQEIEAEEASIITVILNPVISILLAFLIIMETLDPQTLLGGTILVAAGIYLETHRKKTRIALKEK